MDKHAVGRNMPIDTRRRIQCCASDNSMSIFRNSKGYGWHCFRCGDSGFKKIQPTMAEIRARQAATHAIQQNPTRSIPDLSSELPGHAVAFLALRGISPTQVQDFCGWSEQLQRLVFRLWWEDDEGWLMRDTSVPRPRPKYIQATRFPYCTPCFDKHGMCMPYRDTMQRPERLVVTEDILSAHKVSRAGYYTMAVIGTWASPGVLSRIAQLLRPHSGRVTLWLDPDRAGEKGSATFKRSLTLMGISTNVIRHGNKDPKCYDIKRIQTVLGENYE